MPLVPSGRHCSRGLSGQWFSQNHWLFLGPASTTGALVLHRQYGQKVKKLVLGHSIGEVGLLAIAARDNNLTIDNFIISTYGLTDN